MNANNHVKIYASTRQEAFFNYESDIKANLFGATTIIQYSDEDLSRLLDQLTQCYEGGKTFKEFVNLAAVRNRHCAFPEDSFRYLVRHSLGRPRDLVILASELSRNQKALTEAGFRRVVEETSASVLAANVFEETRVFLDCLGERSQRLGFLSLLPCNILTRQEVVQLFCRFNHCDPDNSAEVDPSADSLYHPFWELYSAGLLGFVETGSDGSKVQRFKQPHDLNEGTPTGLPNVAWYLIHPGLDALIRKQRPGSYNVCHHIVVGHNYPWESYYGTLSAIEKALYGETDDGLRDLAHSVLNDIIAYLHNPPAAGANADGSTPPCSVWRTPDGLSLKKRLTERQQLELLGLFEQLAGTCPVTPPIAPHRAQS
jgi:hypothetical protein